MGLISRVSSRTYRDLLTLATMLVRFIFEICDKLEAPLSTLEMAALMCHRIENLLLDDILEIEEVQKAAARGDFQALAQLKEQTHRFTKRPQINPSAKLKGSTVKTESKDTAKHQEVLDTTGDIINNTLTTLAATIVWIALQSDEVVSNRQYTQRDLIHTVYDFTIPPHLRVKQEQPIDPF